MRKILHVGTHKTATTSFQACLRNNRDVLAEQNLIFPDLSEVGLPDGVGHHSLIGQLAEKPDRASDAVSRIHRNSEKTVGKGGTVLISSERCYRHTISADKDEKPRQKRRNFVKLLSEVFGRDTEVAVVLRRPDNFAESSYQETIKKGNRTDNIQSFLKSPGFGMRLDYAFQLRLFRKAFDQVHVFIYEDLIEGVEGPEMELLRGLGLDVELAKRPDRRNTSLHAFLIEYKRLINYQKLPPVQLKNLIEKLLELQKERRFEWTEERLSFLTLADRQSILEKHREGLNWIADEFFEGRTTPLFSPPDQPKSVFSEMPVAVFEEIHREVCSGLNGRSLFF